MSWTWEPPRPARRKASTRYQYELFVSYTTREEEVRQIKPFIDALVDDLKERGVQVVPVYYDTWYLEKRPYRPVELSEKLTSAIKQSAFTLAFVSPGYISSEWCQFEWRSTYAIHRRRGSPATAYSLLPVVWKRIQRTPRTFSEGIMLCSIRRRLRRFARTVDISDRPLDSESLVEVAGAVAEYVQAWES